MVCKFYNINTSWEHTVQAFSHTLYHPTFLNGGVIYEQRKSEKNGQRTVHFFRLRRRVRAAHPAILSAVSAMLP